MNLEFLHIKLALSYCTVPHCSKLQKCIFIYSGVMSDTLWLSSIVMSDMCSGWIPQPPSMSYWAFSGNHQSVGYSTCKIIDSNILSALLNKVILIYILYNFIIYVFLCRTETCDLWMYIYVHCPRLTFQLSWQLVQDGGLVASFRG